MAETYIAFFKTCQKKEYIANELDPVFLTQSLMGILHHFMRTEPIRERLLSQKNLKHKADKDLMIENIVNLFLSRK
jgi:hypothetical protein